MMSWVPVAVPLQLIKTSFSALEEGGPLFRTMSVSFLGRGRTGTSCFQTTWRRLSLRS